MITMTEIWGPSDTKELVQALKGQEVPVETDASSDPNEPDHRSTFVD